MGHRLRWQTIVLLGALAASLVLLSQRSAVQARLRGIAQGPSLVGRAAPELPTGSATLDGAPLRLADLRGRVVLLHFWTFG
jgi:hypothetical protein